MPALVYSVADFTPFTKIISADVNSRFSDIQTLLNTTKLDDTNIQDAGITRSSKLSAGTADYVVINDNSGNMSEEAQLATSRGGLGFSPTISTANSGKAVVVNTAGNALELGTPEVGKLVQSLHNDISGITAGEAISANDAVALALNEGTYKIFKADSDAANRNKSFLGFSKASASVTAGTYTLTSDADLVTSNVIALTVNGRPYSENFDTDNDTTMSNIASAIASDPDVQSASVVDSGSNDRVINITGTGGLTVNITGISVTGGASQANFVFAEVSAPSGDNVTIHSFGPLSGFSSLTVGRGYYLSTTAGAITDSQSVGASYVGQALSSTVLFANPNRFDFEFGGVEVFVRSHGSSAVDTSGAVQDTEEYNYTAWSAGTSASAGARALGASSSGAFNSFHHAVDGVTGGGSVSALHTRYNKTSWETLTTRGTAQAGTAAHEFASVLYINKGSTSTSNANVQNNSLAWNGSTWATKNTIGTSMWKSASFVVSNVLSVVGGVDSGGSNSAIHETKTTADTASTATNAPATSPGTGGTQSSGLGITGHWNGSAVSFNTYTWNGSAWSSAVTCSYDAVANEAASMAGNVNNGLVILNGGEDAGGVTNQTGTYNGSAWATSATSTNSRGVVPTASNI